MFLDYVYEVLSAISFWKKRYRATLFDTAPVLDFKRAITVWIVIVNYRFSRIARRFNVNKLV